jgi:hypothetical protein
MFGRSVVQKAHSPPHSVRAQATKILIDKGGYPAFARSRSSKQPINGGLGRASTGHCVNSKSVSMSLSDFTRNFSSPSSLGLVIILDRMAFREHPLVKNAGHENATWFLAVENHMPAALHPAEARTDIIARPAELGRGSELLATRFQIINIAYGLVFAPLLERVTRDIR